MVKIIVKIEDNQIISYKSDGHAINFKTKLKSFFFPHLAKYNSICAALSTLEYTFLHSIENLSSVSISKKISSGKCLMTLKKNELKYQKAKQEHKNKVINKVENNYLILCHSFLIGLKMISNKNENLISLQIVKNKKKKML